MAKELKRYKLSINGRWEEAASGKCFETVNPYTGEAWALLPEGGEEDVDRAVRAAREAFESKEWKSLTGGQRGQLLRRLGDLIAQHAERLARIETTDNGKIIRETTFQLKAIPDCYYYFAGWADKIHGEVIPTDKPTILNYTLREPIGVVGAIIPWNSPLYLTSIKLAPALAAGNTVVIKPSEITSVSALEFIQLVEEAGFPPGAVNVVTGFGEKAGAALTKHQLVGKIAFTGGCETGKLVAKSAADHLARVTLELGGKSPNIVFEDADLDSAVNGAMAGIFAATGQTCIAGSRLFLHESIHDRFVEKLVARAKTIKMGDPTSWGTEMGPLAFKDQREKVLTYVEIGKEEGAKLVYGGEPPTDPELKKGYFVKPTVFVDVENHMRIAQEEIFGPVVSVIRFRTEEEVIQMANDVRYGLAAGLWTQDVKRVHRLAKELQAGTVWVNTYRTLAFSSPFGGYKESGIGKENGFEVLREYTQLKSVWVETGGPIGDPFVMR
ncbi:MAG: aldehyde dehydrogenase [candidate division NC10 bacterium]|nr:aldehyde dehydrogenase [candidate division NC10 bacterium]